MSSFEPILKHAEDMMISYYDWENHPSALDYLLCHHSPQSNLRGQVLVCPTSEATEIGIFFDETIRNTLTQTDPRKQLNNTNLDAFCVLIEELSHFHLLTQRSLKQRQTSRLELEYQGELDKFAFSEILLELQTGTSHSIPLSIKIFDECHLAHASLYQEASKLAERFWRTTLKAGLGKDFTIRSDLMRSRLKREHEASMENKRFCF